HPITKILLKNRINIPSSPLMECTLLITTTALGYLNRLITLQACILLTKNGGNRTLVLAGQHENPSWSPDGQWLVFSSNGEIQKCRIDGTDLTTFSGLEGQHSSFEDALFFPDWTSDGRHILFDRASNKEGESNLYSMKSDFTNARPIFGNIVVAGRDPELSPVNSKIAYMKASSEWLNWEIFVMDTTGSFDVRLTNNAADDRGPTWSPD